MVKFASVVPGSVVQLGRFNKERAALSHAVGMVREKRTVKFGTSTFSAIAVEVRPGVLELVSLHNIKQILN